MDDAAFDDRADPLDFDETNAELESLWRDPVRSRDPGDLGEARDDF